MNKVGKYIVSLRKENNVKQEKLAEEIDISVSSMSNIEEGKDIPKVQTMGKLIKYFNMSPDNFYKKAYSPITELESKLVDLMIKIQNEVANGN